MRVIRFSASCFALLAMMSMATVATADTWTESGDAGDIVTTGSQDTIGAGVLDLIVGATDGGVGDIHDTYIITITDAANFYATTEETFGNLTGSASFDTRLYLHELDGTTVMGNDDIAPSAGPFHSIIGDGTTFAGNWAAVQGGTSVVNGQSYLLTISGFSEDAFDSNGVELWGMGAAFDTLVNGDGGLGVLASWEGTGATGQYTIELGGATFSQAIPEPATAGFLAIGFAAAAMRRRRS